jgi:5-methylcytosine-specific restriction protein A
MPTSSPRPCRRCRTGLTSERHGYCPACLPVVHRERDARRGSSSERGYTRRWAKASRHYLAQHPLCVSCQARSETEAATVVDHIVPHRGDQGLFWDRGNWQPLCKRCHDKKTASGEAFCRGPARANGPAGGSDDLGFV